MIFYHFQLFSDEIVKKNFSIISISMMFLPGPRFDFLCAFLPQRISPSPDYPPAVRPAAAMWAHASPASSFSRPPPPPPPSAQFIPPTPSDSKKPRPCDYPVENHRAFFPVGFGDAFQPPTVYQAGRGGPTVPHLMSLLPPCDGPNEFDDGGFSISSL